MKFQITSFFALFLEEEVVTVRDCFFNLNRYNVVFCFVFPLCAALVKSFIFRFRDLVVTLLRQALIPQSGLEIELPSDMNAVQAFVLWIIASDREMSAYIFPHICYLIRKQVP
jgi:hypothetical protein